MQTVQASLTINVKTPLTITTTTVPDAVEGQDYVFQLEASGGTPPYQWEPTPDGALPAGIALLPSGVLEGNPTANGPFTFGVKVTDSAA